MHRHLRTKRSHLLRKSFSRLRPQPRNPLRQSRARSLKQPRHILILHLLRQSSRRHLRSPQNLIRISIPNPAEPSRIGQRPLQSVIFRRNSAANSSSEHSSTSNPPGSNSRNPSSPAARCNDARFCEPASVHTNVPLENSNAAKFCRPPSFNYSRARLSASLSSVAFRQPRLLSRASAAAPQSSNAAPAKSRLPLQYKSASPTAATPQLSSPPHSPLEVPQSATKTDSQSAPLHSRPDNPPLQRLNINRNVRQLRHVSLTLQLQRRTLAQI